MRHGSRNSVPSESTCRSRPRLPLVFGLILSFFAFFATCQARDCEGQAVSQPDAAVLFLLDHSGSMNEPSSRPGDGPKPSRWVQLKADVSVTLDSVRLGTVLWIGVFEGRPERNGRFIDPIVMEVREFRLNSEADREQVRAWLKSFKDPVEVGSNVTGVGGTALFDSMAITFERAIELSRAQPGRGVRVFVFTDGEDTHSKNYRKHEIPPGQRNVEEYKRRPLLEEKYKQFYEVENGPFHLYEFRLDKQPPKISIFLGAKALPPLPSPAEKAEHAGLQIVFEPEPRTFAILKAAGKIEVGLEYAPQVIKGVRDPLEARVGNPKAVLELLDGKARLSFDLTVTNAGKLDATKTYSGAIKLNFPDIGFHEVTDPCSVAVNFQVVNKYEIFDHIPLGGMFPVNRNIDFQVLTDSKAMVTWDFGDKQSGEGLEVKHAYSLPGEKRITVKARHPKSNITDTRQFAITVVELNFAIAPLGKPLIAGVPLDATVAGSSIVFRHVNWSVFKNDQLVLAQNGLTVDAAAKFTFDSPGDYRIVAQGRSDLGVAQSDVIAHVLAPPSVKISEPDENKLISLGTALQFKAHVDDEAHLIEDAVWLLQIDGEPGVEEYPCAINEKHEALLQHVFDTKLGNRRATVKLTPRVKRGAPVQAAPAVIHLALVPPDYALRIISPVAGNPLIFGSAVDAEVELAGSGAKEIASVVWTVEPSSLAAIPLQSSSVAPGTMHAKAVWQLPWESKLEAMGARLTATGKRADGSIVPGAVDSLPVRVVWPALTTKLNKPGETSFRWNDSVPFNADASQSPRTPGVKFAQPHFKSNWNFGDKSDAAAFNDTLAFERKFNRRGTYNYAVQIEGEGKQNATLKGVVTLEAKKPSFDTPGTDCGVDVAKKYPVGSVIDLKFKVDGDVVRHQWTYDGKPLPVEAHTLTLPDLGEKELSLRVWGPPDESDASEFADYSTKFRVVPPPPWWLMGVIGLVTAGLLWLVILNGPRNWKLAYAVAPHNEETGRVIETPNVSALKFGIDTTLKELPGGWNIVTKKGKFRIADLNTKKGAWQVWKDLTPPMGVATVARFGESGGIGLLAKDPNILLTMLPNMVAIRYFLLRQRQKEGTVRDAALVLRLTIENKVFWPILLSVLILGVSVAAEMWLWGNGLTW